LDQGFTTKLCNCTTFITAFIFCAVATPGYRSAILYFTGNTTGGTIMVTGPLSPQTNLGTLTEFQDFPFTSLTLGSSSSVDNGTYALTSTTLAFDTNTDALTLQGEIPALGIVTVHVVMAAEAKKARRLDGGGSVRRQ
jgi:hypothetical protein